MSAPVEVEHQIVVNARAQQIYQLLADVQNWPQLFPPTVHVERFQQSAGSERIRIWATANGEIKNWTSQRLLDPARLRIDFRQEVSQPPVSSMGGAWLIEAHSDTESVVRLRHDYTALDDDPAGLAWIAQAVERNSSAELKALKANLETVTDTDGGRVLAFADSVVVDGQAEDVFDFLNEAQLWAQRLPHVARVSLTEDTPGLQVLEMDTRTKDGSAHTTKSIRVCFPHERIIYKQITLPSLMSSHTGCWTIGKNGDGGVDVSSAHTVVINEANIESVLGPEAGLAQARDFVRDALGANSRMTLSLAKEFAERGR